MELPSNEDHVANPLSTHRPCREAAQIGHMEMKDRPSHSNSGPNRSGATLVRLIHICPSTVT